MIRGANLELNLSETRHWESSRLIWRPLPEPSNVTFAFQTQQSARVVFSSNKGRIFTKRYVSKDTKRDSHVSYESRVLSQVRGVCFYFCNQFNSTLAKEIDNSHDSTVQWRNKPELNNTTRWSRFALNEMVVLLFETRTSQSRFNIKMQVWIASRFNFNTSLWAPYSKTDVGLWAPRLNIRARSTSSVRLVFLL